MHVCCGPCAVYPVAKLRENGFSVTAFFFNPNIHPYLEYKKRLASVVAFCASNEVPLFIEGGYQVIDFLRSVVNHEHQRCTICQSLRIIKTVEFARSNFFASFTTSLLYSRYQNHIEIRQQCEALARESDIEFYYEDFRLGWQFGIDTSIAQGLYRQSYCGCIYSEQERYDKTLRSKRKKVHVKNDCFSHHKQEQS